MRRLTVGLIIVLAAAFAPTARAASCLDTMPVPEVRTASSAPGGLAANGLTVSRGIAPEPFDVTVLGVLEDGVAPDVDMIIVEADSPALDRAGGIWAGMSGSPVYEDAPAGRLIGAVAYGLAFGPSKIGGLAAADDMAAVLDRPEATLQRSVRLPRALRRKVAATGEATAAEVAAGLERLPLPLSVSGLSARRLGAFAGRLTQFGRVVPYRAAGVAAAPGNPAEIVPGGNFAAALSYGDLSAAGVGTTTAVCGDQAVAFGHPMAFLGKTALSAHAATAITIQDDPAFVPFKLANVGGTVGTLDQDRLSGVRALVGPAPTPVHVRSTVVDPAGATRTGETSVNRAADVPLIAAFHMVANVDRVIDRIGEGRALVRWTATGTAGGEAFTLLRTNRFADPFDISFASPFELLDQLATLVENPFTEVTLDSVRVQATIAAPFRDYRITGVQRRAGKRWVAVDPDRGIEAAPGRALRLRVLLAAHRSRAAVAPVEARFAIPEDAAGSGGSLEVTGGSAPPEEEFPTAAVTEPGSFKALVAALENAPRNDDVTAQLSLFGAEAGPAAPGATVRRRVAEVVTGALSVPVSVRGRDEPPTAPRLHLRGRATLRLGPALRRGIRVTVATSEPGRLVLRALVDRRTARRLGIRTRARRAVVVGTLRRRVPAGRTPMRLKVARKAKARLKHARRVRILLRARITDRDGHTRTDRSTVVLRRRR